MDEVWPILPDMSDGWTAKSQLPTVLNVDNNPAARQSRTRILRRGGFNVLEAGCAAEALRLTAETLPSLVLLDIHLPDINGFAVSRRIKSDPRTANIPVLLISSPEETEHGHPESLHSGSDAYVKEPVSPELLLDLTKNLIRCASAERAILACPLVDTALHGGDVRNGELMIRRPDGCEINIHCNIADGRLLETALNTSMDGIAIVDCAGNITRINPAASALFGISSNQPTPKHMLDLDEIIDFTGLDGTPLAPDESPVMRSARGETIQALEMLVRIRATGESRMVRYRSAPVLDEQGAITHVVVNVHDITESQRAAEELRQSELRWRILAETMPEILLTSVDGFTCDYANQRAMEYSGLPCSSIVGLGWKAVIHPEDLDGFLETIGKARDAGAPLDDEVRLRAADGGYRWFRIRFVPLPDSGGAFTKWIGAASNIDDLKRLERQLELKTRALEELNARLLESNDDLQQLAAALAHDLQSPLNAISICSYNLEGSLGNSLDPHVVEDLGFIVNSTVRMREIVRSVPEYAPFDCDERPALRPCDCGELLARTAGALSPAIEATHSVLTYDPLPTVFGNSEQLEQVFQNLIDNAIKYRNPAKTAHIHVSATSADGEWIFSVEDNGMGFDESGLDRIFKPYVRLHPYGLAICQRIVKRHGGRIWARSNPGQGSRFYFSLLR